MVVCASEPCHPNKFLTGMPLVSCLGVMGLGIMGLLGEKVVWLGKFMNPAPAMPVHGMHLVLLRRHMLYECQFMF